MRFFNAQRPPSSLATDDFENLAMSHQSQLRQAERFKAGEEMRHSMGLLTGLVGGLTGFGTIVAVGAGVLSAVALPIVLPVAAGVGVLGLASLVVNKLATWRAARQEAALKWDLEELHHEAHHRGLSAEQVPSLPGLPSLAARIDARLARQEAQTPAVVAPSTRRPGLA